MIRRILSSTVNRLPQPLRLQAKKQWVSLERALERPQLKMRCALDSNAQQNLAFPSLPSGYELQTYAPTHNEEWRALLEQSQEFGDITPQTFQSELLDHLLSEGAAFVAHNGQLVACAAICALPAHLPAATLSYVVVRPEHRGHKLGKIVTAAVLEAAQKHGFNEVILYTDDERVPAIITYAQLGFVPALEASPGARARWRHLARKVPGLFGDSTTMDSSSHGGAPSAKTARRNCDSCGAAPGKTRWKVGDYNIVECDSCGLVYVAEEVTREMLDAYYNSDYYQGGRSAYDDYLAHGESRKHHYRAMMPALKRYLVPGARENARVLDVGCAAGYFLEVASEAGWKAQGVELSPYMSSYARDERGLSVQTGTIEEADLPLGHFDLITMWDVIEHVQNPSQVLRRANQLLAPGGVLVLATGDVAGVTARIFGARWTLIAPPAHLFYFSRRTLGDLLQKTGFQVEGWESDGTFLVNQTVENPVGLTRILQKAHEQRFVNAALRRLKWGSVMTLYARKTARAQQ